MGCFECLDERYFLYHDIRTFSTTHEYRVYTLFGLAIKCISASNKDKEKNSELFGGVGGKE